MRYFAQGRRFDSRQAGSWFRANSATYGKPKGIYQRCKDSGIKGFDDRPRRPYRHANQLVFKIEAFILRLRKEHPSWGASTIREKLRRMHNEIQLPAISTVHAVLHRHGLVPSGRGKKRHRAEGTAFSLAREPNDLWCSYSGDQELTYPLHDRTVMVTNCGRTCVGRRKINLSKVFAGENIGIKEVEEKIWLVTSMHYDLGFFDHETGRIECAENPFGAKVKDAG